MVLKVYGLMWLVGGVAAAGFYLTGNLNPLMTVVFGFLSFGTVFMGMLALLPYWVKHQ